MYRKYILEKNWSKTIIPALSSGQTKNDTPILGCRHQLDDHNRNPNMNNRDHLVGRPTTSISDNGLWSPKALWVSVLASTHTDALIRLLKVLPNVVEDVEWIAGYIQLEHFVAE